jgi:hypothetical protein
MHWLIFRVDFSRDDRSSFSGFIGENNSSTVFCALCPTRWLLRIPVIDVLGRCFDLVTQADG